MKKFTWAIFVTLLSFLIVLAGSSCSSSSTPSPKTSPPTTASNQASPAAQTSPAQPTVTTAPTTSSPPAQSVIRIKYGSINPPTHPYSMADDLWMTYVEKQTNGRVKFDKYWAATLISAENGPMEVAQGVADIGYTDPAYSKTGFPVLKEMKNMYIGVNNTPAAIAVHEAFFAQFPTLLTDYPSNTIPIHVYEWAQPFSLWTTQKPINKVDDLKGMSIRTATFNVDVLKAAGAQPVVVPMSETYLQLQKNIVQGVISPAETLASFKFAEIVKYQNKYANPCNAAIARMWNKKFYNNLPPDIQKIIMDSYSYWNKMAIEQTMAATKAGEDAGKQAGVQLVPQSPEEKAKWDALWTPVGAAAAKRLDDQGLPGTKAWNIMQKSIEQYKDKQLSYDDALALIKY